MSFLSPNDEKEANAAESAAGEDLESKRGLCGFSPLYSTPR
jgi:hypothetical protein